uniref:Uncharacterized protein n=1 Tax=Myoviridae sp. ct0Tg8 TaxID=2826598 RepID=A0A8S5NDF4_9CAUD|nr:MAG TPA: hypothetical protein [Myoviridae sp. ct0Tg8]
MQSVGDGMPKATLSYTNWDTISTFATTPIIFAQ